jgi:tetratricopeptide (TPR) repeat protein
MGSNTPIVRQTAWISIIPQISFMTLLFIFWWQLGFQNPFIIGALHYLAISWTLRLTIPRFHRKGIKLVKQKKFEEAIVLFEKSHHFFTKYNWIDRFRYLTLLSSSRYCYKEMAMTNIAYCYGQIGKGELCVKYYEQVLEKYPNNGIAQAAINFYNSTQEKKEAESGK